MGILQPNAQNLNIRAPVLQTFDLSSVTYIFSVLCPMWKVHLIHSWLVSTASSYGRLTYRFWSEDRGETPFTLNHSQCNLVITSVYWPLNTSRAITNVINDCLHLQYLAVRAMYMGRLCSLQRKQVPNIIKPTLKSGAVKLRSSQRGSIPAKLVVKLV